MNTFLRAGLLALGLSLVPHAASAQAGTANMTVLPDKGSVGTVVRINLADLVIGRTYTLRLVPQTDILDTFTANSASTTRQVTIPQRNPGHLTMRLQHDALGQQIIDATHPFTLVPEPQVTVLTASPQAGKWMRVQIDDALVGQPLLVLYRTTQFPPLVTRTVWGPQPASAHTLAEFLLPADFPAQFPATMQLEVRTMDGRRVLQSATQNVSVLAPFAGRFVEIDSISVPGVISEPAERVRISGRLDLRDGTLPSDLVNVSAFFERNDGSVVPLGMSDFSVNANGDFEFFSAAAGRGSMMAVHQLGAGRVVLNVARRNLRGRLQTERFSGAGLNWVSQTLSPASTLQVRSRLFQAGGTSTALPGALVVVRGEVPHGMEERIDQLRNMGALNLPDIQARGRLSHGALAFGSPLVGEVGGFGQAPNQYVYGGNDLPEPACGATLSRRFTDALGFANYSMEPGIDAAEPGPFAVVSTQLEPNLLLCEDIEIGGETQQTCRSMKGDVSTFFVSIYTGHLGAGERICDPGTGSNCVEMPRHFHVRYDQPEEKFTITDLQSGAVEESTGTGVITVVAYAFTQVGNYVGIADLEMYQRHPNAGSHPYHSVTQSASGNTTTFGNWINFGRAPLATFNPDQSTQGPITRHLQFRHAPGAGGSLVEAQLYLDNLSTGQPTSYVGDFVRSQPLADCDAALDGGTELWRLQIPNSPVDYAHYWRYPEGPLLRAGESKRCGEIRFSNTSGASSKRRVCFEWQDPPPLIAGLDRLDSVEDTDPKSVRIKGDRFVRNQVTTSPQPPDLFGEPVEAPVASRNENTRRISVNALVGMRGLQTAARHRHQDIEAQMNRPAATVSRSEGVEQVKETVVRSLPSLDQTILDLSIPLFRWYWGVPEILSARVYADLRILSKLLAEGTLTLHPNGQELVNYTSQLTVAVGIVVGLDIKVLFGLFFDAGAYISGWLISHMPVSIVDNVAQAPNLCMEFRLDFDAYVDPCPFCPTPVIRFEDTILRHYSPSGCSSGILPPFFGTPSAKGDTLPPIITPVDMRLLRRDPAIAFDRMGNGQVLARDANGHLVAWRLQGDSVVETFVLSQANNIASPQVAYFQHNRAIALWAESDLSEAEIAASDYEHIASRQHVMWSVWNGVQWTSKQAFGSPGAGEGLVALATCYAFDSGCGSGGKIFAAWQRRTDAGLGQPEPVSRIAFVVATVPFGRFPIVNWSAPEFVDPGASNVAEITPAASFMAGDPVVVWVRHGLGTPEDQIATRSLYYRVIGQNTARQAAGVPRRVAMPSVAGTGPSKFRVAFTLADPDTGFIGTRHALHTAKAACVLGVCTFIVHRERDIRGRAIYGERPTLVDTGESEPEIVMRAFQFGPSDDGEPVQPGDPLGSLLVTGDLLRIASRFDGTSVRHLPITSDGGMHMSLAAAFNPEAGRTVALSTVFVPEFVPQMKSALDEIRKGRMIGYGMSKAIDGALEMHALDLLPDLTIESVQASVMRPTGGQDIDILIDLGNRGSAFDPLVGGTAELVMRWDLDEGAGLPVDSIALPALAGGEGLQWVRSVRVPDNFLPGQARTLYLQIIVDESLVELDGDNNAAEITFDGLPVPQGVRGEIVPGTSFAQLAWEPLDDPLVAGFRIYTDESEERILPLGSTLVDGFLDISASYNVPRTYRVSSYSADGVESPLSDPVTVTPFPLLRSELFSDGFEALPELVP